MNVVNDLIPLIAIIVINPAWICLISSQKYTPLTKAQSKALEQGFSVEDGKIRVSFEYMSVVSGIVTGIEHAVAECRRQFLWHRWNCPARSTKLLDGTPLLTGSPLLSRPTREAAYLEALLAAGVTYYVSKASGHPNTGAADTCDDRIRGRSCEAVHISRYDSDITYKWEGCQQNFGIGVKVARLFLGLDGEAGSNMDRMKKHNALTGIKLVTKSLVWNCKCHGPTGSCSTKTCWNEPPEFPELAKRLKRIYDRSQITQPSQDAEPASGQYGTRPRFQIQGLAYSETSPDYCQADNATGYLGTIGRECKRRASQAGNETTLGRWERSSCQRLCRACGYKVRAEGCYQTLTCEGNNQWCSVEECTSCVEGEVRYFCGKN